MGNDNHLLDDILNTPEGKSFLETMERVKRGEIIPGKPNPPGCLFPHCSCNAPWDNCEKKFTHRRSA